MPGARVPAQEEHHLSGPQGSCLLLLLVCLTTCRQPENLVINSDGHTVLTDMGLAKHVNIREGGRAFSFCGTPEYLSPEMIQNEGHNHGVDWWAFAVLIFEMLCGCVALCGCSCFMCRVQASTLPRRQYRCHV